MSQAPRGKKDWMKNHYEKVILLVALVALLFSSVHLVQHIQANKTDAALSLARVNLKGSSVSLKDTVSFDDKLGQARAAATAELEPSARTVISEMRVSCVKCGRPIAYAAAACPFCLAEQPEHDDGTKRDTDGDGLPDLWELDAGLDAQNPADAHQDLDGDGFSNLEEFQAETDVRDPEKFPDPIVKLRVLTIRPVPFYLRFVGTSAFGDGSLRYQLNLQSAERTYFARLGEVILGYKVEKHDPKGRGGLETLTMVRQSDKRPVELVKGRPVTEQELVIRFGCLLDRVPLPPQRLHDVFSHRDVEYKVVDIRRDSVVIQNVKTGKTVTVPQLRSEERAALSGRSEAPARGAASGAPW
ncbi:MAG: hypothetical protein GX548_01375 [Lentisphaerae bacterium]|nr:hypothetical protein [Lentisphaerota bacterium]